MTDIWSTAEDVRCIHPRGPVITGNGAIIASWQEVLENLPSVDMKVRLLEQWSDGASAVHLVEESFHHNGKPLSQPVIATNFYRSEAEQGWKMVMHFAAAAGSVARKPRQTLH